VSIKEKHEHKGSLVKEIRRMADLSNDDGHSWSGEDEQEWTRVNEALDTLQAEIDDDEAGLARIERATSLEASLETQRRFGREDRRGNQGRLTADAVCTDEHRGRAMTSWLRHANGIELDDRDEEACQIAGLNPRRPTMTIRLGSYPVSTEPAWHRGDRAMIEKRAGLNVAVDAEGAFTVPTGFQAELERTLLAFGGPRQVARVIRTDTGNQIEWPTVNDSTNTGVLLAEATTIGASVDPVFAQKLLDAYKYSSKPILVSSELLTDSAFDMGSLVPSLLGERLGRITATQYTTGTGSSQPNGCVTASTLGKTTAGASAITGDEIIDLIHSVDPAYRVGPSVGFMFHDGILLAIRKLKTSDLQYIWQAGFSAGVADTILGYPFTINQDMQATVATATKTMLFGDFSKFIIRDVASVVFHRMEERYRDLDQSGFIAFLRSDSELIQSAALNHMLQA